MIDLTLAQLNPTVGDLDGNAVKILDVWARAKTDLVVFPELMLCGYPPEDLITNPNFIKQVERKVESICEDSKTYEAAALIPCPWRDGDKIYNAALLIHKGEILAQTFKHHLPNYGVFDEQRVFDAGPLPDVIEFKGHKLGVMICEDMWHSDVASHLKAQGAEILIVPNGSPWRIGKETVRESHATSRVQETGLTLVYVNQVGGQDELVFDGGSFVMSESGDIPCRLVQFDKEVANLVPSQTVAPPTHNNNKSVYEALKLGLGDYVHKNGFSGVVIGLSGGIDSALTAAIAVDALGADNVRCVMLPSPFTSQDSLDDAKACAEMLGTSYEIFEIHDAMKAFESTIPDLDGIAHENMQSRTRGLILMALSNATGDIVVTTDIKKKIV